MIFSISFSAVGSPVIISEVGSKNLLQSNKDSRVTIGTNVTAALGSTLTIKCPFEGSSDSQVTWNVDKQPIGYNERIRKTGDNGLMIKNMKFFDSGVYTCKVWNSEGHDSEKTLLTISGMMIISHFMVYFLYCSKNPQLRT